jgi:Ca2+-binding RTX toxin-like protein
MALIIGTPQNDTLPGTDGPDLILGLAGDDLLRGLEGDDSLFGGPGNDSGTVGESGRQLARAAKRDVRVGASGRWSNQAAMRSRSSAAAVATFCSPVFAKPR